MRLVSPGNDAHLCDYGRSDCRSYQRFSVSERIVHAKYKRAASNVAINDIGLLKLNKEIQFTERFRPICLPTGNTEPLMESLMAGGWGRNRQRNSDIEKRATPQHVLTDAECSLNTVSNETHICTRGLASTHALMILVAHWCFCLIGGA